MGKRLYVGNIPFSATEEQVREFFSPRPLTDVHFITDRDTGRPRGYCFVELASDAEAEEAIAQLDGEELGGRTVVVNPAKDRAAPNAGGARGRRDGRGSRNPRDGGHGWTRE